MAARDDPVHTPVHSTGSAAQTRPSERHLVCETDAPRAHDSRGTGTPAAPTFPQGSG